MPLGELDIADVNARDPARALDRIDEVGLVDCLATEKSENIDELRPSIRHLGATGVHKLVVEVFEHIDDDAGHDRELAAKFGLDAATFSRFAGRRWKYGVGSVPDLWRNLARLLASSERFQETCRDSGVWDTVQKIVSPASVG